MNRPRWQKVISDLWGNRTRSLTVVASIAVGLLAIGIIATLYAVIADEMRNGYAAVNPANIYIRGAGITPDVIDHIKRISGVRQALGVRFVELRVANMDDEWESINIETYENLDLLTINQVRLLEGSWPPGEGEIVVDQYKLPGLGAEVGDTLRIELPSGKTRELTLVGVVKDQTIGANSGGGGFFNAPAKGFITQETLEWLEQEDPYSFSGVFITVDLAMADDKEAIRELAARLTNNLESIGVPVISTNAHSSFEHPNGYLVDAIVGVLFVLGLLVVFLGSFLVTSTLQALLAQQTQQIGIMKTVGGRRLQIAGVYVALILFFGLIALLIAAPLAYWVTYRLAEFLAGTLNFVLSGERVIPWVIVLQAVLALVMPQAAAWLPIWQGTRISVQEALSGIRQREGGAETRPSAQARSMPRARPRFSRPMLIATRNTFRQKGRLALTLVTLTLGGAVFIATFNVQVSMGKYIDQIGQYFLSDVNVSLERPYRTAEIEGLISQVPGVSYVEGWATSRSELLLPDGSVGEQVHLLAPPPGSTLIDPILTEGRWIKEGDRGTIALSELFQSRYPELKVGDTLTLNVDGRETDWLVVGFFQFAGKNGGFTAYTTFDYLTERIVQPNQAATYRVVGSGERSLTRAEQDDLARRIEKQLVDNGIQVADLSTSAYLTEIVSGGFGVLTNFLLFLAVLTALVGSIGLAGTMSMNVMERTREIGVMRAIGASDRILMRMVLVEGLIIGAISYVLGFLLAFPISKVLSDGISLAIFDAPSSLGFTPSGFLIWLGAVIILSFLASVIPARSAARLTIREVLAYE